MKLIAWALAALARRDAELAAENARLRRETISMSEQVMAMRVNLRDAHNLLRRHNAQASECRHGRCGPGSPWHDTIHWFGRQ